MLSFIPNGLEENTQFLTEKWKASTFCGTMVHEATMGDGERINVSLMFLHIPKANRNKENNLQSKSNDHWGFL